MCPLAAGGSTSTLASCAAPVEPYHTPGKVFTAAKSDASELVYISKGKTEHTEPTAKVLRRSDPAPPRPAVGIRSACRGQAELTLLQLSRS